MRRVRFVAVCLVTLFCFLPTLAATAQPLRYRRIDRVDDARIDRLAEWLKAVESHQPGVEDEAFESIRAWSGDDLQALSTDASFLAMLIAKPRATTFTLQTGEVRTDVVYAKAQLDRMRFLACAASGSIGPPCAAVPAGEQVDDRLVALAGHARAARRSGDRNYVLRRAALLHTDIATSDTVSPFRFTSPPTAQWVDLSDGRAMQIHDAFDHFEIARSMLDRVIPAGGSKPEPERDQMVRDWYVATAAWMEGAQRRWTQHLDRAREIFPRDPDLLFLSGCQHEAYAAPMIQEPLKQAATLPAFKLTLSSGPHELDKAEEFFRRALSVAPDKAEARMRLGHVLVEQRRYEDAARELPRALAGLEDQQLQYYVHMFIGAAEEGLGRYDGARDAYERASMLYPSAQSPHIALSELAWRRGDRAAALTAYERMIAVSDGDLEGDPWWSYYTSEVRDPEALLDRVRQSATRLESP